MNSKSHEAIPDDGLDQLINLLSGKCSHLPTAPYPRKYCLTNVRSSNNYTIPSNSTGNFTIVVLPASIGDRFAFLYEDMGNGTFTLAQTIQWAIDADTFYDYGRVVSCVVEVFASTISTTTVALSGMISAAQPDTKLSEITGTGNITEVYGYSNLPSFTTDSTKIIIGQNLWQGICSVFYGLTEMPFVQLFDYPATSQNNKVAYRFDPTQSVGLRTSHLAAVIPNVVLLPNQTAQGTSDTVNFDGMIISFSGTGTFNVTTTNAAVAYLLFEVSCIFRSLSDAFTVTAYRKVEAVPVSTALVSVVKLPTCFTFPSTDPAANPPIVQPIISYRWNLKVTNVGTSQITLNSNTLIIDGEFMSYNSKILGYGTAPQIFTITGALPGTQLSINALQRIEAIPNEDTIKFVDTISRPICASFIMFYNMVMSSLEYYGIRCFKNRSTVAQEDTVMLQNVRIMLDQADDSHAVDALRSLVKLLQTKKDDEDVIPEASMRQLFKKTNKLLGKSWNTTKKIATPILKDLSKELLDRGKSALADELMRPYAASGRAFALDSETYSPPVVSYKSTVYRHNGLCFEIENTDSISEIESDIESDHGIPQHIAMNRDVMYRPNAVEKNDVVILEDESSELKYPIKDCVLFPTVYAKTESGKAIIMKDEVGKVSNVFAIVPSEQKTLNYDRKYQNFKDSTICMLGDIECHKVNAIDWNTGFVYCDIKTPVVAGRSQELAQIVYNMKLRGSPITTYRLCFSGSVNSVGGRDLIEPLPLSAAVLKLGECSNKGLTLVANSDLKGIYKALNIKEVTSLLNYSLMSEGHHALSEVDAESIGWYEISHDTGKPVLTSVDSKTIYETLMIDCDIQRYLSADYNPHCVSYHYAMNDTEKEVKPKRPYRKRASAKGQPKSIPKGKGAPKVQKVKALDPIVQVNKIERKINRMELDKRRPTPFNIVPSRFTIDVPSILNSYTSIGSRDYGKLFIKRLFSERSSAMNSMAFEQFCDFVYLLPNDSAKSDVLRALFFVMVRFPKNELIHYIWIKVIHCILQYKEMKQGDVSLIITSYFLKLTSNMNCKVALDTPVVSHTQYSDVFAFAAEFDLGEAYSEFYGVNE
jgi:hypothetical protein